jgi:hypothetical protein
MEHLSDVTQEVVERILAPANIELMNALDGDRQPSPFSGQARLLGSYYKSIAPVIRSWINKYEVGVIPPNTFFECLIFIVDKMKEVGRAGFDEGSKIRKELVHIDDSMCALLLDGKLKEMLTEATLLDEQESKRILDESFKPDPDIDPDKLKEILQVTAQQIASRSSILNDVERPSGVSKAWDEWCEITRETLKAFILRKQVLEEVVSRFVQDKP